jgi:hypothetical protein
MGMGHLEGGVALGLEGLVFGAGAGALLIILRVTETGDL